MLYHGTNKTETIWIGPSDDVREMHYIELIQAEDKPVFYVTACCNHDWIWTFDMNGASNYEMIKHTIMDAAFASSSMGILLDNLDAIFEEDFADMLAEDEDAECACQECNCEQCGHRSCLG